MLDMAKSKGWELETIEVSGSKAFCDEVAKQISESKAKEKAELTKNRTEKPQKLKAKRK